MRLFSHIVQGGTCYATHENELYFLSFRITSSYIVTFTCTCNVRQKSKALRTLELFRKGGYVQIRCLRLRLGRSGIAQIRVLWLEIVICTAMNHSGCVFSWRPFLPRIMSKCSALRQIVEKFSLSPYPCNDMIDKLKNTGCVKNNADNCNLARSPRGQRVGGLCVFVTPLGTAQYRSVMPKNPR